MSRFIENIIDKIRRKLSLSPPFDDFSLKECFRLRPSDLVPPQKNFTNTGMHVISARQFFADKQLHIIQCFAQYMEQCLQLETECYV